MTLTHVQKRSHTLCVRACVSHWMPASHFIIIICLWLSARIIDYQHRNCTFQFVTLGLTTHARCILQLPDECVQCSFCFSRFVRRKKRSESFIAFIHCCYAFGSRITPLTSTNSIRLCLEFLHLVCIATHSIFQCFAKLLDAIAFATFEWKLNRFQSARTRVSLRTVQPTQLDLPASEV